MKTETQLLNEFKEELTEDFWKVKRIKQLIVEICSINDSMKYLDIYDERRGSFGSLIEDLWIQCCLGDDGETAISLWDYEYYKEFQEDLIKEYIIGEQNESN